MKTHPNSSIPATCCVIVALSLHAAHARQIDFQGSPTAVPGTVTEPGFTPVTAAQLGAGVVIDGVTIRGENFAAGPERDRGLVNDQGGFTYGDLLDDCVQFLNTTSATTTGRLLITGLKPTKRYSLRIWCHDPGFDNNQTFTFDETGGTQFDGAILNTTGGPYPSNTAFSFQVTVSGRSSLTYALTCSSAASLTKINGLVLIEKGTVYEAENGVLGGGALVSNTHAGFSGSGFVDYPNTNGSGYVEWTVPVETSGTFDISIGYGLQAAPNRPTQLLVDGVVAGTPFAGAPTGAWTTYVESPTTAVTLAAGNRVLRLRPTATSIAPNIDYLRVMPVAPARVALAAADPIVVPLSGTIAFNPLANDSLPLGSAHQSITVSSPGAGIASVDPQTRTISYQHTGSSTGTDQFTYTTTDVTGLASSAAVSVTITDSPRIAATTLTLPTSAPSGGSLQIVDALPGLTFAGAVGMTPVPGSPKALLIASINGNVWMVPDTTLASPVRKELFNLAGLSNFTRGRSIYSITCHPGFATNGLMIVNYQGDGSRLPPLNDIPHLDNKLSDPDVSCDLRVSGFTISAANLQTLLTSADSVALANAKAAVIATEIPYLNLAEQQLFHSINDCHFGPDGFLYVSFGDEGDQGEPYLNAQKITRDQYSSIIRIDVDRTNGNPEPNPHYAIPINPATGFANFSIPPNNPYAGPNPVFNGQPIPAADLTKVRTEIWATGLRNPFKFEIDPPTGEIWVGDVGMDRWEEVSILQSGDNAGWSYWEGNEQRSNILHAIAPAVHKAPEHSYFHSNGNNSVTGGVLYRGTAYTSLQGKYIFGDYGSGRIWSLTRANGPSPTVVTELPVGGVSAVVDFEVDAFTGQILMLQHESGRRVMRLVEGSGNSGFPQLLSETGAFTDLQTLAPNPGVVAYEPNLTFWSDHALKSRFFGIKNLVDRVGYSRDGNWTFPEGMVFIKHFEIDLNRDAPGTVRKRLETRFLVRNAEGAYGVSYRWNDAGTEASLVSANGDNFDLAITQGGQPLTQTWRIPSRGECLTCHTPGAGHALSFNTLQLNRPGTLSGDTGNFLSLLDGANYLTGFTDNPATLGRHFRPDETQADLESRVRSYLAVNCAYCHQPGSGAPPSWDGRPEIPLAASGILYGNLVSESYHAPGDFTGVPGQPARSAILSRIKAREAIGDGTFNGYTQMPPLASNVVDAAGAALIEQWLLTHANMPPAVTPASPTLVMETDAAPLGAVIGTIASLDPDVRGPLVDQILVRYSITAGNDESLFTIDPVTGLIRVNGMLEYDRRSSHVLTVTATDQFAANPGISNHTVTIDLSDAGEKDLNGNGLPDFWETGYSLVNAQTGGDGDHDGVKNYFEFLGGGDPGLPDEIASGPEIAGAATPPQLLLEWRQRNGLRLGEDYFLQGSDDLAGWTQLALNIDYEILSSVPDGLGFTRLTVRTLGGFNRQFARLSNVPLGIALFNGVDLSGWQIREGSLSMYKVVPATATAAAYIEGTANGVRGMLATTANYADFELNYDFMVENPMNSGVQFRSFMTSNQVQGYQVDIDPTSRAWTGGLYEQRGRGWLFDLTTKPDARAAFRQGEWNHIRLRAVGTSVKTWINGVPATDYTETLAGTATTGFIALQVHEGGASIIGKKVRFRNLRLIGF